MCPNKKSKPKGLDVDKKDLSGFENLTGLSLEHDSCYRGRIDIYRCKKTGRVVKMDIVR